MKINLSLLENLECEITRK